MKWIIAAVVFPTLAIGAVLMVLWNNDVLHDVLDEFGIDVNLERAKPEAPVNTSPQVPVAPNDDPSQLFWEDAKPIIEQQIAGVGQPLTNFLVQNDRELRGARLSGWYEMLLDAGPRLEDSYNALSDLLAPSGRATRWHEAQLRAWAIRLDSIEILSANWNKVNTDGACGIFPSREFTGMTNDEIFTTIRTRAIACKGGFSGSAEDFQLMSELWDQSILAGREADRLQSDFLVWLSSGPAVVPRYHSHQLDTH